MDENSTPASTEHKKSRHDKIAACRLPSKKTVEFLRQFARCYNVYKALPAASNVIVPN